MSDTGSAAGDASGQIRQISKEKQVHDEWTVDRSLASILKKRSRRPMPRLLAVWFIVQIVLPFTAPLQACDLADLLGHGSRPHSATAPESSSVPTTDAVELFLSPVDPDVLRASTTIAVDALMATGRPVLSILLSPPPPTLR